MMDMLTPEGKKFVNDLADATVGKRDRLQAENTQLRDALDPDTLEAIADEIDGHEHSARAGSLRVLARQARAALEYVA